MFTGIVTAVGTVSRLEPRGGDLRLTLDTADLDLADVVLGDSISVNGVCLTVVAQQQRQLAFDLSRETLERSSLQQLSAGSAVNLEKALAVGDRLGGHFVSGHVDGLGTITKRHAAARSWQFQIAVPGALSRYIAEKGSICVDGVSLTVNAVSEHGFDINIIPHTFENTVMRDYQVGSRVNLEVDLIARYLERLLPAAGQGLSLETLMQNGFIRS